MPCIKEEVTVTQEVEVDFEVYCGSCGCELCSNTTVDKTSGRRYNTVTVCACDNCLENASSGGYLKGVNTTRDNEQATIDELREEVDCALQEIASLKEQLGIRL